MKRKTSLQRKCPNVSVFVQLKQLHWIPFGHMMSNNRGGQNRYRTHEYNKRRARERLPAGGRRIKCWP